MNLAETLKGRAFEIGFDLAGIAPIDAPCDLEFASQWVKKGFGGEMSYLANPKRDDLRLVLPSVRSVLCLGLIYNAPLPYSTEAAETQNGSHHALMGAPSSQGPRGWISRYAWGRDYHDVMRGKLEQLRADMEGLTAGVETRVYVDTGPVVERAFARTSGIGWTGKNTCLIHQQNGSWFFLGVILTNLALAPDMPAPDRCGSCTRCLDACPTGALIEPYVMDASRCIAYLTIELKGSIPADFRPAIGNNVFGCDICQDVCPWNSPQASRQGSAIGRRQQRQRGAATTHQPEFLPLDLEVAGQQYGPEPENMESGGEIIPDSPSTEPSRPEPAAISLFNPPLQALASLGEEGFRRAFSHSPIKRAKYRGWLRNLCVAMGNSGDASFIPRLEQAARHKDEVVREHAEWALERLRQRASSPPAEIRR